MAIDLQVPARICAGLGRRLRNDRPLRVAVGVLGGSVLAYLTLCVALPPGLVDLNIYRLEGAAIRYDWDLYGDLPGVHGLATYPPFAAIVFVPVSLLSLQVVSVLFVALTLLTTVYVCVASARLAGAGDDALRAGLLLAAAGLWSEPVFKTLGYGQINVLILALILWDFTLPSTSRWRGAGVGLATAIKVTPGIFIVYLLVTRRWRMAATAAATFAGSLAVSLVVNPSATWAYWTQHLHDPLRVGRLENSVNQSVRGALVRLDHSRDSSLAELGFVVLVLVGGITCAAIAYRVLGDSWGLPAAAVAGLLTSPISWSHHWVWYLPVAALLWYQARRWLIPAAVVFQSYAVWAVPHGRSRELALSGIQVALSNWYVYLGLLFLALVAVRARSASRRQRNDADHRVPRDRVDQVAGKRYLMMILKTSPRRIVSTARFAQLRSKVTPLTR